ncbi:MAG: AarF/ABC1/UbiB kinase family protein [Deltaproteobacteria bacterium]|nr:AarF/ABC1/UbiB kinase family protein [Deltaproteobacteria bacterium]
MRSRFVKAYTTTFVVIASYLLLRLLGHFMPRRRYQTHLLRLHKRNARRIERTILELKGMFIKVGQLISIMTNFLPAEFREELEGLQDQIPPHPYEDIARRLREEFGREPEEIFAEISPSPISSASIGQVHVARLRSGEKVAVKIQYPEIERIVRVDLHTFRRIFRIIELFVGDYGLETVHAEISDMIAQELDFVAEGRNIERIAGNLAAEPGIGFPRVHWELTSARVLTTELIDGVKISATERLDELGIDRPRLAQRVIEAYCKQIFRDGVYHADPHPGNLLIEPAADRAADPRIVFVDFGAVAVLSDTMRRGIIDFLQGVLINDVDKIIASMKHMGFIARADDSEVFEKVVTYFHGKLVVEFPLDKLSLQDIKIDPQRSLENLADLRKMDISIRDLTTAFHVPKEYVFLERTVLLLMGLCTHLDPGMNPMSVITPYLQQFILGEQGDWSQFLVKVGRDGLVAALSLPGEARRLISRSLRGDMEVRFRGIEEPAELLYALGHQLIWALFAAAGFVAALLLELRGLRPAARACVAAAGVFAVLLLGSMWRQRAAARRRRARRRR